MREKSAARERQAYTGLLVIDFPVPGYAQVFDPVHAPHAAVAYLRGFDCKCKSVEKGAAALYRNKLYYYGGACEHAFICALA